MPPITPIQVPGTRRPAGHYSQAIVHGGLVYVSGQIPADLETGTPQIGTIEAQTELVLGNLGRILRAAFSNAKRFSFNAAFNGMNEARSSATSNIPCSSRNSTQFQSGYTFFGVRSGSGEAVFSSAGTVRPFGSLDSRFSIVICILFFFSK